MSLACFVPVRGGGLAGSVLRGLRARRLIGGRRRVFGAFRLDLDGCEARLGDVEENGAAALVVAPDSVERGIGPYSAAGRGLGDEPAGGSCGLRGGGARGRVLRILPRSEFIHVDLGPARQCGERFPVRATAFAAETPPSREVLADSRAMKGGGAAGLATLGAAGVEAAQSVLAETQIAILPLAPYLDTLRWVFIAFPLGGIAVTIYALLDDWKRSRQ